MGKNFKELIAEKFPKNNHLGLLEPTENKIEELMEEVRELTLKECEEKKPAEWKIDRVESYWYRSNKFYDISYEETTFWYNPETLERKETKRTQTIIQGQEHQLEDWARTITNRNKNLESL